MTNSDIQSVANMNSEGAMISLVNTNIGKIFEILIVGKWFGKNRVNKNNKNNKHKKSD